MPIVTFWSNTRKETAQTLSMLAIASYMSVEKNSRILMVDVNSNDKTIQNAYFNEQDTSTRKVIKKLSGGRMDIGSGIDGLSKLLASGKNSGESITNYAQIIFKGRLEVILSYISGVESDIQRVRNTYKDLIRLANQQYDYVFVDLPKGLGDPVTEEILAISDVIVFNITQRQIDIDNYVSLKMDNPIFKSNNVLPLIRKI